jgi:hypothetical protein
MKICSSRDVMDARCAVLLQHMFRSPVYALASNQELFEAKGEPYRWLLAPAPVPNLRRLAQST